MKYTRGVQRQQRVLRQDPARSSARATRSTPTSSCRPFWLASRLIDLVGREAARSTRCPNVTQNLVASPAEPRVGPRRQVLAAVAVRHDRHRVQHQSVTGSEHHVGRRPPRSGVQGQDRLLTEIRDTRRPLHAGRRRDRSTSRRRPTSRTPWPRSTRRSTDGQIRRFTRQRLRRRPRRRRTSPRASAGRATSRSSPSTTPTCEFVDPRVRRHALVRHHGHAQGRRASLDNAAEVDGLRLRPGQRRQDHGVRPVRVAGGRRGRTSSASWAATPRPSPTTRCCSPTRPPRQLQRAWAA